MVKFAFRKVDPKRTCTKQYADYKSYKPYLVSDFNKRCGYTDSADRWFGGSNTFHIDHFQPLAGFPALETTYENLVYSCSYVNILKSNDHPSGYIDPCHTNYSASFFRDDLGTIFPDPTNPTAVNMHEKMKLGLARYQIMWQLDNLLECITNLQTFVKSLPQNNPEAQSAKDLHFELTCEFTKYLDYLTK